ncbi:hypothetical protein BB559_001368 [Furculomyces boomerangus]|uniref:Uncharacterized protein n=2 Tax=Harpellales TaxID=61421 RepID=A0A2T9Z240_9FUNG|nr:hypothetical protein BB559_001368 [Furculomyces boomerangus]PVZ98563.1 hypothetical protein BB558_005432 [Smittium angustum]PWA02145.1 hypothetical protein BB558_001732 [Smittium angustum]
MPILNFKERYIRYSMQHNVENNNIVHGVSGCWNQLGAIGLLSLLGPMCPTPSFLKPLFEFNPELNVEFTPAVFVFFYNFFIGLLFDPIYALFYLPWGMSQLGIAAYIIKHNEDAFHYAYLAFTLSILANLLSHIFIEKNKPSLFVGDYASFLFSPFFSNLNCVLYFGYRPYFYYECRDEIDDRIAAIKEKEEKENKAARKAVTSTPSKKKI